MQRVGGGKESALELINGGSHGRGWKEEIRLARGLITPTTMTPSGRSSVKRIPVAL